jgi:hypothetical protein
MASTVRITELRKVPAFQQWWNDMAEVLGYACG